MATPQPPPPQHISLQCSPAPAPKVRGTQCVLVGARANTSRNPGSAQTTPFHLLVDATQGGIVPVTTHGARFPYDRNWSSNPRTSRTATVVKLRSSLSSQPIASRRHGICRSAVTWDYEDAEVPTGIQSPSVPKKPGKRKKGRKGVEDDGGVIVPPDHLVAGVGSSWWTAG